MTEPTFTLADWRKARLGLEVTQENLAGMIEFCEHKKTQSQLIELLQSVSQHLGRLEAIEMLRREGDRND